MLRQISIVNMNHLKYLFEETDLYWKSKIYVDTENVPQKGVRTNFWNIIVRTFTQYFPFSLKNKKESYYTVK